MGVCVCVCVYGCVKWAYLQRDVCLLCNDVGGDLQEGLPVHKVHADKPLTSQTFVTLETLAHWVCTHDNTLRPIGAVMIVTRAGPGQHHRRGELTEQTTANTNG